MTMYGGNASVGDGYDDQSPCLRADINVEERGGERSSYNQNRLALILNLFLRRNYT